MLNTGEMLDLLIKDVKKGMNEKNPDYLKYAIKMQFESVKAI